MVIGWPQAIVLALILLHLGIALGKDGEPRRPWSFPCAFVDAAIFIGLLWWGGFFK